MVILFLLLDSICLIHLSLLDVWQWPKNVGLNHFNDLSKVWNEQIGHVVLSLNKLIQLVDSLHLFFLALVILALILVVIALLGVIQKYHELLLGALGRALFNLSDLLFSLSVSLELLKLRSLGLFLSSA